MLFNSKSVVKVLPTLLLLLLTVHISMAQTYSGIKSGLSLVSLSSNIDGDSHRFRPSYHIGVGKNKDILDGLRSQVEIIFHNKGSQLPFASNQGTNINIHLYYISVPLIAQIRASEKTYLELGTEVAYLLWGRQRTNGESFKVESSKKIDIGMSIGLSYDISEKTRLNFRYTTGLITIDELNYIDDARNRTSSSIKSINRTTQVSVMHQL